MKKLIAEFLGTFFLMLVIVLTGNPLAIGLTLSVMVYTFGYISGGHFNPAVTIAMLIKKQLKVGDAIGYILVQFAGSAGAMIVAAILGKQVLVSPAAGTSFINALLVETIFTFALVTVILNVAVSKHVAGNQYYGLAIGLVIFIAATAGGAISGGAFNPAVGVVPQFFNIPQTGISLTNILLYILGPVAGGILATAVYSIMNK